MAFFKSLLIASVAAVAFAAPQGAAEGNTKVSASKQSSDAMCGNGQKLACCNSGEDLIGANCLSVPVLAIPIQQACGSNVAACCSTGDASGNLINLELNCLAVPPKRSHYEHRQSPSASVFQHLFVERSLGLLGLFVGLCPFDSSFRACLGYI